MGFPCTDARSNATVHSYDNAGNTTGVSWSGGSISLSWDAEARLKSETAGSTPVNYVFNGIGQRVQETGGVTASYVVADDSIDSEVLSDGAANYAHGASGIISENRSGTSKFYHADALGSVRALTKSSGSVTDSKSTDAFGLIVTTSGSTPTPFGFAGNHGYQQDDETGLMRLGHRMYDASTGRFISRDPIRDGYNWYTCVQNDPVNGVDPEGLYPDDKSKATMKVIVEDPNGPKPPSGGLSFGGPLGSGSGSVTGSGFGGRPTGGFGYTHPMGEGVSFGGNISNIGGSGGLKLKFTLSFAI